MRWHRVALTGFIVAAATVVLAAPAQATGGWGWEGCPGGFTIHTALPDWSGPTKSAVSLPGGEYAVVGGTSDSGTAAKSPELRLCGRTPSAASSSTPALGKKVQVPIPNDAGISEAEYRQGGSKIAVVELAAGSYTVAAHGPNPKYYVLMREGEKVGTASPVSATVRPKAASDHHRSGLGWLMPVVVLGAIAGLLGLAVRARRQRLRRR